MSLNSIGTDDARTPRLMLISLWRRVREARRLPLLPLVMLLVVLVIPAVFAPLIAPHSPLEGDLNDRLLPPFWVGETVKYKTVVEKVNRENRLNEILLKDAERRV